MNDEHKQFLTENCNRLKYGACHTLGCMRRGGHKSGDMAVDYSKATCVPYEIFKTLELTEQEKEKVSVEEINRKFAELAGICWHERDPLNGIQCTCGLKFRTNAIYMHIQSSNPNFCADPRKVIGHMRLRSDFQDFYRYIGSYYNREFHAWMHDEKYILNKTGLLALKGIEWVERRKP